MQGARWWVEWDPTDTYHYLKTDVWQTPILGETADGKKTTRSDPKILPGTTIYDVDFTMTLPEALSATSGVNAIAHAGKMCKHPYYIDNLPTW